MIVIKQENARILLGIKSMLIKYIKNELYLAKIYKFLREIALVAIFFVGVAGFNAAYCFEKNSTTELASNLKVGDLIFIRIPTLPFKKIAQDTNSWTNHVGIVESLVDGEPLIAESTFPTSTITHFVKFLSRSEGGRVAVKRLNKELSDIEKERLSEAAYNNMGIFYDTGFDINSKRQFCSRFVREVLNYATGVKVGKIENLKTLFADNPDADLIFWRVWYLGFIPWERETVTPASILEDNTNLNFVFDGFIIEDEVFL